MSLLSGLSLYITTTKNFKRSEKDCMIFELFFFKVNVIYTLNDYLLKWLVCVV